jgi:hypothetical protein
MSEESTAPVEVEAPAIPRDEQGRFAEVQQAEPVAEPDADQLEEVEQPEDLHENKPRGKTAQDRINDLTRARREAERERDFYKGLVSQPTPASPVEGAPKPTADSFDTYDDYVEALTDWKVEQTINKQSSAKAQQTTEMVRAASWDAKLAEAVSTIPDFADVVGSSEIRLAKHVEDAMVDSDLGGHLAYHFAQHPELVERLNNLSPNKAALEMGRLEVALSTPVAKPTTKAPAPVTPIRSAPARQDDLAKVPMDQYIEMRRKQGAPF